MVSSQREVTVVQRSVRALLVAWATVWLTLAAGCTVKAAASRTNLTTNHGSRDVKAALDGNGSIVSNGDTVTITFAGGKLTVEKEAVKLDGEVLAKLAADTRKVEVDYTAGKLTVKADGKSVASRELGR